MKGKKILPRPAGHAPPNAPQDPIDLLGSQGTLLAHGHFVVPQHSQALSAELLSSRSTPSLYWCLALFLPRCRTQDLPVSFRHKSRALWILLANEFLLHSSLRAGMLAHMMTSVSYPDFNVILQYHTSISYPNLAFFAVWKSYYGDRYRYMALRATTGVRQEHLFAVPHPRHSIPTTHPAGISPRHEPYLYKGVVVCSHVDPEG